MRLEGSSGHRILCSLSANPSAWTQGGIRASIVARLVLKEKRCAAIYVMFSPEHVGICGWVTRALWNVTLPENTHPGFVAAQMVLSSVPVVALIRCIFTFSAFPNEFAGWRMVSCESSAHTRASSVLCAAVNGMWLGLVREGRSCRWYAVDTCQLLLLS